ncbi:MAG: DUF2177 family protein [Lewinellaceae bacterium]|nr:DUF2177 family protein [Lewinellaceae bacterium]
MTTSKLLLTFLLTTVLFFAIDLVWLGLIAKGLYQKYLGSLLSPKVNWTAAVVFYLLFIVGIFIFAILPAIERNSWQYALLYGALFGFFTYATYDLTNLATLKGWPLPVVFIDIAWGMFLTGSVALGGYFIAKMIAAGA